MLPDGPRERNGIRVTLAEHQAILEHRLSTLEAASAEGRLDGPLPVRWRVGYRCTWFPVARDAQGSLLLILTVTATTRPGWRYQRKIRLVASKRLPSAYRRGLREN